MSSTHLYRRTLVAIAIVPLYTLLGCASKGVNPNPQPLPLDDTTIANGKETIESMFAGRFPGVTVTPVEGGGLKIRIRGGNNSFLGSDDPLYVVDDVPIQPGQGGILFLNPYDIATIQVLKNPEDVGLYGVRGGNGVIKITLKKPGRH